MGGNFKTKFMRIVVDDLSAHVASINCISSSKSAYLKHLPFKNYGGVSWSYGHIYEQIGL